MRSKDLFYLAIGILLLAPILLPLYGQGFPHAWDTGAHLIRMAGFHEALLDGQFPPRWLTHFAYDWGSPVLMFNWSLPYWLAEPFIAGGITIVDSFKIVILTGVILSFFSMYGFLRTWLNKEAAIAGGIIYCWAPYRLNTIYVRGAIGEATAFAFWPLIFWSALLIMRGKPAKGILLGSISFSLILLSHQVMFLMIIPLWLGFIIFAGKPKINLRKSVREAVPLLISLGLTSFFWIPAFFEKGNIAISQLNVMNFRGRYFSNLPALLSVPGFFSPNGSDPFLALYPIGLPQIFWVIYGNLITFIERNKKLLLTVLLLDLFFILGIYLLLPQSSRVWDKLPLLPEFIYPLRFLGLLTFISALLAGIAIFSLKNHQLIAAVLITVFTIIINYRAVPINTNRDNAPDSQYFRSDGTGDMQGEFLPEWADPKFTEKENYYRDTAPVTFVTGSGQLKSHNSTTRSLNFTVNADSPSIVMLKQFYFPGWQVSVNGITSSIGISAGGAMLIGLPGGTNNITAKFVGTPLRKFADLISLLTLLFVLLLYPAYLIRHSGER